MAHRISDGEPWRTTSSPNRSTSEYDIIAHLDASREHHRENPAEFMQDVNAVMLLLELLNSG